MKWNATIFLATFLLILSLANPSYALSTQQQIEAGILPNNFFYIFDLLGEKCHLAITKDTAKKTTLLLNYAEERYAEAQKMLEEGKTDYINSLMHDYITNLSLAQNQIGDAIVNQTINAKEQNKLIEQLSDTSSIINPSIESKLDINNKQALIDSQNVAMLVSFVMNNVDRETIIALAARGLGYNEIAIAITVMKYLGISVDDVIALIDKNKNGIQGVLSDYGLDQFSLIVLANNYKKEALEKTLSVAEKNNDTETINKIKKSLVITTEQQKKVISRFIENTMNNNSTKMKEQFTKTIDQVKEKVESGAISNEKALQEIEKAKKAATTQLSKEVAKSKESIESILNKVKSTVNDQHISTTVANELKKQTESIQGELQ